MERNKFKHLKLGNNNLKIIRPANKNILSSTYRGKLNHQTSTWIKSPPQTQIQTKFSIHFAVGENKLKLLIF